MRQRPKQSAAAAVLRPGPSFFMRAVFRPRTLRFVPLSVLVSALFVLPSCDRQVSLQSVLHEYRWIKPRLSGDHPVELCAPKLYRGRSDSCPRASPPAAAVRAQILARDKVDAKGTLARAALFGQEPEWWPRAESAEAEVLVNASAAALVRGDRRRQPYDYQAALLFAGSALRLNPRNTRALYNYALAAEKLYLDEEAVRSWQRYLGIERSWLWRREGELHLERLSRPTVVEAWADYAAEPVSVFRDPESSELVVRFSSELRERFLQTELPRLRHGPPGDECRLLEDWLYLGEELARATGDTLVQATSEWLLRSHCHGRKGTESLWKAIGDLVRAREESDRSANSSALVLLEGALSVLSDVASPLQFVARLRQATELLALSRNRESLVLLEELEPMARSHDLTFVAGRAAWLQGTIELRSQNLARAREHYERARADFDQIGDLPHAAAVRGLLGETLGRTGLYRDAWVTVLDGLELVRGHGSELRLFGLCSLAGILSFESSLFGLADLYQSCAVDYSQRLGNMEMLSDSYLWRAAARLRLEYMEQGREDLQRALEIALLVPDQHQSDSALHTAALVSSALEAVSDPSAAVRALDNAIDFFRESQHRYYELDGRLLRAGIMTRQGQVHRAEEDLKAALRLEERYRVGDSNSVTRLSALFRAHSVYDQLTKLYLERPEESWKALFFADRGKQDRLAFLGPVLADLKEEEVIQEWRARLSLLPAGTTVLSYHLLDEELVAWTLRPGARVELNRLPLDLSARPVAVGGTGSVESWDESLSSLLPLGLEPDGVLVVIPDKELADFPFARLRYNSLPLVETTALVVAASLDGFLSDSDAASESLGGKVTALIAPESPAHDEMGVAALPLSDLEIDALRASFPDVLMLVREQATATRLLEAVSRPGVVHLTSHADVQSERPLGTALLLAPDGHYPGGRLSAAALYDAGTGLGGFASSLVMLAACETSATGSTGLSSSLVGSLLGNGVPAVVGALKPVRDDHFVLYARKFYSLLSAGESVPAAARGAQLALKRQTSGSSSWADIQLYATNRALDMRRDS